MYSDCQALSARREVQYATASLLVLHMWGTMPKFMLYDQSVTQRFYCRLLLDRPIDEFCEDLVSHAGVLLLPATIYDHQPSVARRHFRVGLGRKNLPDCLTALDSYLNTIQDAHTAKTN